MSQATYILTMTVVYTASSYVAGVLYIYMWRVTHLDRVQFRNLPTREQGANRGEIRRRHRVLWRNEVVASILCISFVFCQAPVGTFFTILNFHVFELPWTPGLATITLLTIANNIEMMIAVALVHARRDINRALKSTADQP